MKSLRGVPNAPCGVESNPKMRKGLAINIATKVPNAPCGVESRRFHLAYDPVLFYVPNAPCGVES